MADDIDLQALQGGSTDLAGRDFREANLSGLDLNGRDFSGAYLERANITGANLSGSIFKNVRAKLLNATDANLESIQAQNTVFFAVNFTNSNLTNSNLAGAHFLRTNFYGANLCGANFERAVFNEDTTFDACIIDENTRFDGASIFRPLARQNAFRFYHVERGALVRNSIEQSSPAKQELNTGIYAPTPLRFPSSEGKAKFDYSDNDGLSFFGSSDDTFETRWGKGGRDVIHAIVNQPNITGISIAKRITTFDHITAATIPDLDFSSRTRTVHKDQILVVRNSNGRFAAFKIISVTSTSHGDAQDELAVEYRILRFNSAVSISDETIKSESELHKKILFSAEKLRSDFERQKRTRSVELDSPASIGHNNPPEETPLDHHEIDEVITALRNVSGEIQNSHPESAKINEATTLLTSKTKKILAWAGRKLELAADEFAKEIGKSLASKTALVVTWLALSDTMGQLVGFLSKFLQLTFP